MLIHKVLNEDQFTVQNLNLMKTDNHHEIVFQFESADSKKMAKLIKKLRKFESVSEISWSK